MHDCLALSAAREGNMDLVKPTAYVSSPYFSPLTCISALSPPFHALLPLNYFPYFPITPCI